MEQEKATYSIARMARLLGVDRRRFYDWRHRQHTPTAGQQRAEALTVKIRASHAHSQGTYGAPRIRADLQAAGEVVSTKTVAKLMRRAHMAGISPRTWHPPTTVRGENPRVAKDRVQRTFDAGKANRIWYSDITYLRTGQGWAYLCIVQDGHTRRVLGRAVADNLETDLVETALTQAVTLRGNLPRKVIFHADRGTQFTSKQIAKKAKELKVLRSMGRTGVCWDNAAAESFWSIFKNEYYHRHVFTTIAAARQGSYQWIDGWYNAERRHSRIGYQSPLQYEKNLTRQAGKQH